MFLKMLERDLAYRKRSNVNWCPSCQTVLANEQVVDGECWRCGTTVDDARAGAVVLPHHALRRRAARRDARARPVARESADDAAQLDRAVGGRARAVSARGGRPRSATSGQTSDIEVFTTRIDTIYGANFIVLAPEHPLVAAAGAASAAPTRSARKLRGSQAQDRTARMTGEVEKEGFDTGRDSDQSVYRQAGADLGRELRAGRVRHGRGDGRARPRSARLRVREEVRLADDESSLQRGAEAARYESGDADRRQRRTTASSINSGEFNGLDWEAANVKMTADAEARGIGEGTVQYRLKDWGISRQRYWGTPIPVVYCEKCGMVPVPSDALPVLLPKIAEFSGRGDSPLAQIPEFVNTTCPELRRAGAARDGHDGYVRRLVVVLLPVLRSEELRAAVRSGESRLLGAG